VYSNGVHHEKVVPAAPIKSQTEQIKMLKNPLMTIAVQIMPIEAA